MQYRKDKRLPWIVQFRDTSGFLRTQSFATKELAEKFERQQQELRRAERLGLVVDSKETFQEFAAAWLRKRFAGQVAYATAEADERRLRLYWLPEIGHLPLASITQGKVIEVLDDIQFKFGHSVADRNLHRALLHKMFVDAMDLQKVHYNPLQRIKLIENASPRRARPIESQDDLARFLDALKNEGQHFYVLGAIMAFSGCRISEAIGLQWQDVAEGLISFRRIEERAGGSKIVERTKGTGKIADASDVLPVPLLPALQAILEEHRGRSQYVKASDFIASNPRGGYVPYDTWKKACCRAQEKSAIGITAHSFRGFFATEAKKAGFSRSEIKELGRWSSEDVINRYDRRDVTHLAKKAKTLRFLQNIGVKEEKNTDKGGSGDGRKGSFPKSSQSQDSRERSASSRRGRGKAGKAE